MLSAMGSAVQSAISVQFPNSPRKSDTEGRLHGRDALLQTLEKRLRLPPLTVKPATLTANARPELFLPMAWQEALARGTGAGVQRPLAALLGCLLGELGRVRVELRLHPFEQK